MAAVVKGKEFADGDAPKAHRIRITLTSQKVAALEKGEFLWRSLCDVVRRWP